MNTLPSSDASYIDSRRGLKIIMGKENKTALKNLIETTLSLISLVCSFSIGRCHLMQEVSLTVSDSSHILEQKNLKNLDNRGMWDLCCTSTDLAYPSHPPAKVK